MPLYASIQQVQLAQAVFGHAPRRHLGRACATSAVLQILHCIIVEQVCVRLSQGAALGVKPQGSAALLHAWASDVQRCSTFLWADLGDHAPGCPSLQVPAYNLQSARQIY